MKLKKLLLTLKQRILQAPHLDESMVRWTLFLIVTDVYLVLITQPRVYWLEHSFAQSDVKWLEPVLALHPLAFVGLALLYLLIINFVITRAYASLALTVWITTSFMHLESITDYVYYAFLKDLNLNIPNASYNVGWGSAIFFTALLGFSLARVCPQSQPVKDIVDPPHRRRWPQILAALCLVAWFLALNVSLADSMWIPDFGWIPVATAERPAPRLHSEAVTDLARGRVVLFGGHTLSTSGDEWVYMNDTWEWDGSKWLQAVTDIAPPGRIKHAMAYDARRDVVVLFGGIDENDKDLGDTWEWDGVKWEKRHPIANPPDRCCHAMMYHPQRGKVIAYGGYYGKDQFLYGAWEWDGQEWAAIYFTGAEPLASGNDLVYDESLNAVVIARTGNTWLWEDNTEPQWMQHLANIEPPERNHEALAYNPQRGETVLFGGIHDDKHFDDTWILRGQIWQRLELPLSPAKRYGHVMFYDPVRETVMVWGGFDTAVRNDLWELVLPDEN